MSMREEIQAAQALQTKMAQVLVVQEQLRACEAKGAGADRTELFNAMNEVRHECMCLGACRTAT